VIQPLYVVRSQALLHQIPEENLFYRLLHFPLVYLKIVSLEVLQLWVLDKFLFGLIVTSCIIAFKNIKDKIPVLFLSTLILSTIFETFIGELGVNFRYQLPSLLLITFTILFYLKCKPLKSTAKFFGE
jgi:hypothetical protein